MAGIFDHVYFDDQKSETGDDQILNLLGAHEKAHGGEALREPTEDELSMQWHTIASARFFALLETIIENPNSPVLGPEEVGAVAALFAETYLMWAVRHPEQAIFWAATLRRQLEMVNTPENVETMIEDGARRMSNVLNSAIMPKLYDPDVDCDDPDCGVHGPSRTP